MAHYELGVNEFGQLGKILVLIAFAVTLLTCMHSYTVGLQY